MTILCTTGGVPTNVLVQDSNAAILNLYYGFWMTGAPKYRRYS